MAEPEVTTMSQKGQVVIPQSLRSKLGLSPKTKLLVYGYRDTVIMKKLELPEVKSELQALWKEMDTRLAGKHKPTERETSEEIQRHRREKKNLAKAVLLNDRLVKKSRGRLEAEQIIRRFRDQR